MKNINTTRDDASPADVLDAPIHYTLASVKTVSANALLRRLEWLLSRRVPPL